MGRHVKVDEKRLLAALKNAEGDLTRAAVELEVAPSTVYRMLKRYGVQIVQERRIVAA